MVRPEFIVERQGKSFVLYAGLLDLAHAQGLRRVTTKLLQVPSEDNGQTAICSAEVETDRGTFSGIGDASPSNVARAMLTCTIRLAETRAKARALRDAVNVGVAALEELGDEPFEAEHRPALHSDVQQSAPTPIRPAVTAATAGELATPAQRQAVVKLAGQLHRVVDIEKLSKSEASTLIVDLQREAKQ